MSKIFTLKNKRTMPKWLAWVLAQVLRIYGWTIFCRFYDETGIWDDDGKITDGGVCALWHNRLLLAPVFLPARWRRAITVLISGSRDGEYISAIVKYFGFGIVRGSSSRGGAEALVHLRQEINASRLVALTVDGPRGPKYTVHPGAAVLAQRCKVKIYPIFLNYKHYWTLKSWDNMQLPVPFTTAEMRMGKALEIAENAEIPEISEALRRYLLSNTNDVKQVFR